MVELGKRKLAQLSDSEEDEKVTKEFEGGSDEDQVVEVKPIGEPLRRIGRGKAEKRFYQAFEVEGNRFELEDPVLVTPEEKNQKPYVAIIKNNYFLARRLLKRELDPAKVYSMTPAELKDGITAEEKSAQEPEEPETMQMADVRCTICGEKKVGVKDIIHVGYGDRYQLECMKCGNSWYASRDAISSLTIETAKAKLTVGTAPWATSKFEDVEREFMSPREQPHDNP